MCIYVRMCVYIDICIHTHRYVHRCVYIYIYVVRLSQMCISMFIMTSTCS